MTVKQQNDPLKLLLQAAELINVQVKLPVALPPICQAFGVKVERSNTGSARALLLNARTKPRIVLNTRYAVNTALSPWERFLIAHELGHLLLHRYGITRPQTPSQYWQTEALCDAFARALLVPERLAVLPLCEEGAERVLEYFRIANDLRNIAHVDWATAVSRIADWDSRALFLRLQKDHEGRYVVRFTTLPKRQELGRKPDAAATFFEKLDLRRPTGCDPVVKAAIPALEKGTAVAVRVHDSDIRIGSILAA